MAKQKDPVAATKLYVDSNVFLDLIELPKNDPKSVVIQSILQDGTKKVGRFKIVTSMITMAEVLYAKREKDGKAIDPSVEETIQMLWHPSSPVELIDVHELLVKEAVSLYRSHLKDGFSGTKGIDAIHLITAKQQNCREFLSNGPEQTMKKWGEKLGFEVKVPHYEPLIEEKTTELPTTPLFTADLSGLT